MRDREMRELTQKEKEQAAEGQMRMLLVLTEFMAREGRAPSVRELATQYGCGSTFAARVLRKLEDKGYVSRRDGIITRVHLESR